MASNFAKLPELYRAEVRRGPGAFPYGVSSVRGKAANASSFSRFGFVSPSAAKLMISSAKAFLVESWSKSPPLAVTTSQASLKAASRIEATVEVIDTADHGFRPPNFPQTR